VRLHHSSLLLSVALVVNLSLSLYAQSQSATPQSATPQSATPQSATPQSATPQSATPQSATPQSATPQSATPQSATPQSATPAIDAIRKAGSLTCGIDQSEAEFSHAEEHGSRVSFDEDICRAAATALLGPHAHVTVKGYPDGPTALEALSRREIDLVPSVSDDRSSRSTIGIVLSRPVLFDAQGFMVPHSSAIAHAADLAEKRICFLDQSEAEINLHSWFRRQHLDFIAFPFQEEGEMEAAFVTGNCAALFGDLTRLANTRVEFGARAKEYILLPETVALDPLAMAWRADEPGLGRVLEAALNVLIAAEELEVTKASLASDELSTDPAIARLLGKTRELGAPLGLDDQWPRRMIGEAGNFGEIYARDLGSGSVLNLPRAQNQLWLHGGLMFSLPLK
jgi:general L-amino acid transport system substrate-binding protein